MVAFGEAKYNFWGNKPIDSKNVDFIKIAAMYRNSLSRRF